MPLEERVYRLRCVEAWSMVVPWTGFPIAALLKAVGPKPEAKYVRFETAALPAVMPGLRQSWYPWPYIEACTVEEAANDLSFMVIGAYGKPLPPQNGGPIRFHQPWKYGFKAGKSLVKISLVARAAEDLLGGDPGLGIRLLGQCEPGGLAPPLEPGERARAGHRRAGADPALQWLWRVRRRAVHRPAEGAALGLRLGLSHSRGRFGVPAVQPYSPAAARMRSIASVRPSAQSTASIGGLCVLPVSATRSGCATWPSLTPFTSA